MTPDNSSLDNDAVTILVVDDDSDDQDLAMRLLAEVVPRAKVVAASDGHEALDLLAGQAERTDRSSAGVLPKLIFLDLNMPGLGGIEILTRMRRVPALRWIPVVILTTSHNPSDVSQAYEAGANSYLTKPDTIGEWRLLFKRAGEYWIFANLTPRDAAATEADRR